MMKMKRTLMLLLITFIVIGVVLTSCSNQSPNNVNNDGENVSAEQKEEDDIIKEEAPTKVTWFRSGIDRKLVQNWSDTLWIKELEEKMNVDIEFQGPKSGDDYNQAASIMLASGTLTDIFSYDWNRYDGGLAAAIDDGIVVNVGEKYRDKMPTWFALLDENDHIRRAVTLDDGTSALFCHVEYNMKRGAYNGLGIRADWLAKLNLPVPTTIDELYNTMVAFRDDDPNENGETDEIPFSDNGGWLPSIRCLVAMWGLQYQEIQLDPSNSDKITYWTLVNDGESFIDCVTTLNKWYEEKLIDPEFSSQDGDALNAKITSDLVGITHAFPTEYATWNEALRQTIPEASFEGLVPIVGPAGKPYGWNNAHVRPAASNEGAVITTQAEKDGSIDACLRLIDFMYTDEGSTIINWGKEGISYIIDSDGKKSWSDEVANDPEFGLIDKVWEYALPTYGGWPKVMSYDAWASIELTVPESLEAHENYWKADTGILTPPLILSSSESKEYATIMNDVNTAIEENFIKFIIGTRPLSEAPDFIKECKDMRIEEAMSMYQAAYDRYMSK